MTAFAIDLTPTQPGFLSADRLWRWVPWAQPVAAIRDIGANVPAVPAKTEMIDPVLQLRLKEIESLAPGWDDGTALPVSPNLIKIAHAFASSELVSRTHVRPDLVPTLGGGLLFEWHTEAVDLIIEIDSAAAPTFYYCDNELGQEIEAPLGDHVETLATAFRKLMQVP